jgi:hypothetical protein
MRRGQVAEVEGPGRAETRPLVPVIDAIREADTTAPPKQRSAKRIFERMRIETRQLFYELWLILGDSVNQAADLASGTTSIPSRNLTASMTFGN